MRPASHVRQWLLFAGVLLQLVGCHANKLPIPVQPPYTVYRSPLLLTMAPRRVLLLPSCGEMDDEGYMEHWCRLFAVELRSVKLFEVVTPSLTDPCVVACVEASKRGTYSEATLAAVRLQYNVDAVMFVRMDDFFPYWPPRMAVTTNLVETYSGGVLSSIDGNWDGRDDRIQLLAKEFAQHMTVSQDFSDPDLVLNSPEYFGKFVAHQLAIATARAMFEETVVELRPTAPPQQTAGVTSANQQSCATPPPAVSLTGAVETNDQVQPTQQPDGSGGEEIPRGEELPLPSPTESAATQAAKIESQLVRNMRRSLRL
ncbi:MAG: hypothetical protein KDA92_09160 [Planctomycetales bacterium]|nr:hypothetical protein [Planctomycetales bacterium]MCA9170614.1 hypothetical protein [Planctomycetales bacterium]